ncbi:MAG: smalltalk protein [Bacteroidaceae bacterium]|nr:smalltalk protein [Bacteroidaceae bacterium]MBR5964131.1 smalltalk protein [Bacteroidaceae bacterium]
MKHLLSTIEWKRILQFIITVLTAIVGSLSAQSCL